MKKGIQLLLTLFLCVSAFSFATHKDCHSSSEKEKNHSHFVKFKEHSMIISHKGKRDDRKKRAIAIDPATKKPFVIWFVNNLSASPGTGTFESPFNTLVAAQNNSSPHDIIYVLSGDGTDTGMNAGITLQASQQLLGAGILQQVKTTKGKVKIPAQSSGLPVISNTFSPATIGISAVTLNAGDNVVSGFSLVDNIGGGTGGADVSAGILIQNGLNYLIKKNTLSTFFHGNCFNVYGGGNAVFKDNTSISLDANDTFGVDLEGLLNPLQGFYVFENNLWTGTDANSGFDQGIHLEPNIFDAGGVSGNLTFHILNNKFESQTNTAHDSPTAIAINVTPNASNSMTAIVKGNQICLPAGISDPVAGVNVSAHGPGVLNASFHKNVAITAPVPGYRFNTFGNPANLNLDFGADNVGSVLIIP